MRNFIFKYFEAYPVKTRAFLLIIFIVFVIIGANAELNLIKFVMFLASVIAGALFRLDNNSIKYFLRIK